MLQLPTDCAKPAATLLCKILNSETTKYISTVAEQLELVGASLVTK